MLIFFTLCFITVTATEIVQTLELKASIKVTPTTLTSATFKLEDL